MGFFVIFDQTKGAVAREVGLHFLLAPGNSAVCAIDYTGRTTFPEEWNVTCSFHEIT